VISSGLSSGAVVKPASACIRGIASS